MAENLINNIFTELEFYFEPLHQNGDFEQIVRFFERIGWDLGSILGEDNAKFLEEINTLIELIPEIKAIVDDPPDSFEEILEALDTSVQLFQVSKRLLSGETMPNLDTFPQLDGFLEDVLNKLTVLYIGRRAPVLYSTLLLTTIIAEEKFEPVEVEGRLVKRVSQFPKIDFSRLGPFLSRSKDIFKEEYWPEGLTDLDRVNEVALRIFPRIGYLLTDLNLDIFMGRGISPFDETDEEEKRMAGYLTTVFNYLDADSGADAELGMSVGLVPQDEGGPGVYMVPFGSLEVVFDFTEWLLTFALNGGIEGIKLTIDGFELDSGIGTSFVDLKLDLSKKAEDGAPAAVIGSTTGTRFELGQVNFGAEMLLNNAGQEYTLFGQLKESKLIVALGQGDSFLSSLANDFIIDFDFLLGWSNVRGVFVGGRIGLELNLPIHITAGPIEIIGLRIAINPEGKVLPIEASSTFKADLGPFRATVQNVGLQFNFDFEAPERNIGIADLSLGFKPPNGIGLVLDAGAIKGGGYVYFDPKKGEYAGVAELTIKKTISLKAIGIINTKLPDGRPGFAFLLIISAEFSPIQLGFGFTLNGVGGLIGINRGMFIDALVEGVRTNSIDSIMFPNDPVANAPQIIADMNAFFPIEQGRYTFGLMGIIGWGTPTLIKIELGLIIQVPDPIIFAILGVAKLALPTEKKPILKLQVNFLGIIHFEERYMFFFASLFGSKLLTFTLEGDMYFSVDWGNNPNFVFSVGGFHPDYTPPKFRGGITKLNRITINLLGKDNPRLILSGYFAVTSNTVQFGAKVDFQYKVWKVRVIGYLYFDALFQFSPFYFKISIGAGLAVMKGRRELFGIHLKGSLEGPTPWRIKGKASFRILFVKIKIRINKTFGKKQNTVLPPVAIRPLLLEPLKDLRNWQAELPAEGSLLVSLRSLVEEGQEAPLIAHPFGMLAVSQNKMPLNINLDKVGNNRPSDFKSFRLKIKDSAAPSKVTDFFAPAQYVEMKNEEKLSRKSFEKFTSGIRAMGDNGFASFDYIEKGYEYERCIIDSRLEAALEDEAENKRHGEEEGNFDCFVNGGAVAKSSLGRENNSKLKIGTEKKIEIGEESFVIVRTQDLLPLQKAGSNIRFSTQTEAHQKLKRITEKHPNLKGKIKVLSEFEVGV
jgi:hypothetical protein